MARLVRTVDARVGRRANVAPALAVDEPAAVVVVVAVVLAPRVCEETEVVRAGRSDRGETGLEEAGQRAATLDRAGERLAVTGEATA